MNDLPAAISAEELHWQLPDAGEVLCYHAAGDGVPLLLLHSINAAPSAFEVRPLFEALRGERPVYAPDLPGFGRSSRADRSYSPAFFAGAIGEMIDAIGAPRIDLLALSTTAEFAALAACADERRVRSLVTISPTGMMRRSGPSAETGQRLLKVFRFPGLGSGLFRLLRSRASVRYFLNMAFVGDAPGEMIDYACATTRQPGATHAPFHFLSGQLFTANAVEVIYQRVTQPALVLFDRDPNISFERLDELVQSRENWRAQRIPDTRGMPHFDRPGETLAALHAFWGALD